MVDAVSRELILPGVRLDVPPRPSQQQLAVLAERSAEQWTTEPGEWVTQQVVRLAVAALLRARLEPRPGVAQRHPLPTDPAAVTLAELATLFRPHVDLTAQAFELAVVEAVNAGVPAAVDPVRDGLRRVGVTGRDPVRVVALGLDKLPPRARQAFWEGVRTSDTVTAVVDSLSTRRGDVTGLDRSQLARADALVLAGGRTTPVTVTQRPGGGGGGWFDVPLAVVRRERADAAGRREGGARGTEVALRGEGWVEVLEAALDAVSTAMRRLDLGSGPKGGPRGLAGALATRLVAAGGRTVAEVCASLRDVEATALEIYDHQVTTTPVPVAVPVVDDELFVQLWLPTSALAGPLVTGAADLFLGGPSQVRSGEGPRPARDAGRPGRGRPDQSRPDQSRPDQSRPDQSRSARRERPAGPEGAENADGTEGSASTGRSGRRRGGRGGKRPAGAPGQPPGQPPTQPPAQKPAEAPAETSAVSPAPGPEPSPAEPPPPPSAPAQDD